MGVQNASTSGRRRGAAVDQRGMAFLGLILTVAVGMASLLVASTLVVAQGARDVAGFDASSKEVWAGRAGILFGLNWLDLDTDYELLNYADPEEVVTVPGTINGRSVPVDILLVGCPVEARISPASLELTPGMTAFFAAVLLDSDGDVLPSKNLQLDWRVLGNGSIGRGSGHFTAGGPGGATVEVTGYDLKGSGLCPRTLTSTETVVHITNHASGPPGIRIYPGSTTLSSDQFWHMNAVFTAPDGRQIQLVGTNSTWEITEGAERATLGPDNNNVLLKPSEPGVVTVTVHYTYGGVEYEASATMDIQEPTRLVDLTSPYPEPHGRVTKARVKHRGTTGYTIVGWIEE